MKILSFFNNKGGVGKTTALYHVGFALEKKGYKVLFVDGDPQCNLTAHTCDQEKIQKAWSRDGNSLFHAIKPIISGSGDIIHVQPYQISNRNIWIYPGDILLSEFEGLLSESWTQVLAGQERGVRSYSAIYRLIKKFASEHDIDYVLIDVGPNLGSLNRSLLLACDYFIIPLIPDLFSLRGTQNMGKTLANWAMLWRDSINRFRRNIYDFDFEIPTGAPKFAGYIVEQFNVYRSRPTKAWQKWETEIPDYINKFIIDPLIEHDMVNGVNKNYKLGEIKNFNTLIPMAQSALKPIFELRHEDGVIGEHHKYVKGCAIAFDELAEKIVNEIS